MKTFTTVKDLKDNLLKIEVGEEISLEDPEMSGYEKVVFDVHDLVISINSLIDPIKCGKIPMFAVNTRQVSFTRTHRLFTMFVREN